MLDHGDHGVEECASLGRPVGSRSSVRFDISVQDLTGAKYSVSVCQSTTIAELKRQVEQKTGIPTDAQRLLLHQRCLEDDMHALWQCGIVAEVTISLALQDAAEGAARRKAREQVVAAARRKARQPVEPDMERGVSPPTNGRATMEPLLAPTAVYIQESSTGGSKNVAPLDDFCGTLDARCSECSNCVSETLGACSRCIEEICKSFGEFMKAIEPCCQVLGGILELLRILTICCVIFG
jgi:hypothetical protein